MSEYSQKEFERMKDEAAHRVMEMYKGAGGKMPPYPDFISLPKNEKKLIKARRRYSILQGKTITAF